MNRRPCLVACALLTTALNLSAEPILTSLPDVIRAANERQADVRFDLTTTVAAPGHLQAVMLSITDGEHCIPVGMNPSAAHLCPTNPGEIVRLQGRMITQSDGTVAPDCQMVLHVADGTLPNGRLISSKELPDDNMLNRLVRIEGTIRCTHQDELDVNYAFLLVNTKNGSVPVAVNANHWSYDHLRTLVGTRVSITGLISEMNSHRRKLGRQILAARILPLEQETCSKAIPSLDDLVFKRPDDLLSLGRYATCGHVLAVYARRYVLLRTPVGELHRVEIGSGELPHFGQHISATGFPSTDFYQINLDAATWQTIGNDTCPPENATEMQIREIFAKRPARTGANPALQGHTIRLRGRISRLNPADSGIFDLEDGDYHIGVDMTALDSLQNTLRVGMEAEITGTCIMDTQDWNANGTFPSIKRMILVVRTPADIRIISQPPWLTPTLLIVAICILVIVILAVSAWNRLLQKKIEHHGQMLLRARLANMKSSLRSQERTRLAVELHDALSQSLTGVTFQLEASQRAQSRSPIAAKRHFNAAMQTLQSCREELGRCLWDLRSEALEMKDFAAALTTVLAPVAQGADVHIRFNIPRDNLSDRTAHAVLRIIRELVSNAIRHGCAVHIRIAGDISTGALKFSVSDDGKGFDPNCARGPSDGHFGLTGIRERVKELGGTFTLTSSPHVGTKATVVLPTPKTNTNSTYEEN